MFPFDEIITIVLSINAVRGEFLDETVSALLVHLDLRSVKLISDV